MKKLLALTTLLFVLLVSTSFAAPQAPQLCYSATGLNIALDWTSISGATGYTLYYAPFPYKGAHTIGSINMGTSTDAAYYLWENAHYYIAVTARDASGESGYSNIELFNLNSNSTSASILTCDVTFNISGNWYLSINNDSPDFINVTQSANTFTAQWTETRDSGNDQTSYVMNGTIDGTTVTYTMNYSDPDGWSGSQTFTGTYDETSGTIEGTATGSDDDTPSYQVPVSWSRTNSTDDEIDPIVGTWDSNNDGFNTHIKWVFYDDGTWYLYKEGYPGEGIERGTYSVSGNILTLTVTLDTNGSEDGIDSVPSPINYSIENNVLTIGDASESASFTRI